MKKRYFLLVCLLALLIPLFGLFLLRAVSNAGVTGTLASGRSITVHTDSLYTSTQFGTDTAVIKTAGKTIIVSPTQAMVDGKQIEAHDESAKQIEVRVKNGTVTCVAKDPPLAAEQTVKPPTGS